MPVYHAFQQCPLDGRRSILDAANNITMEPYRAFVSDKIPAPQHSICFLTQSFFTGLGITLAIFTPSVLVYFSLIDPNARRGNNITHTTYAAFIIGAIASLNAILYSVFTTKEHPLTEAEIADIRSKPKGIGHTFSEIGEAIRDMPLTMKQLALVRLFTWYGMFCYWQYITLCLARTIYQTADEQSAGFADAQLLTGKVNGTYNIVTFCSAFLLAAMARKTGPKVVHMVNLTLAGAGLLFLPSIKDPGLLIVSMIGLGIGWASLMGTPCVMLAGSLPKERTGVYMGIFNMFIVIPMLLQTLTFSTLYKYLLGSDPQNVIRLVGALLLRRRKCIVCEAIQEPVLRRSDGNGWRGALGVEGFGN